MGKLKEALLAQERFVQERGCYLERLEVAEADPIRYEVFYSRLLSTLQSARETAKLVSGSPAVRETEELVFALYTPEGDSIVLSTGIMAHVNTMSRCIKWMIRNDYEDQVGFAEGDYFANNDPYVGGLHVPDVMDITPFFYEGEMIGWIGGVTHVIEVGAVEPGAMPVSAVTRFHEGKIVTPTKIAVKDQIKRDYEVQIERSTRAPIYWLLDEKAKIAGCRIIRDAVKQIIDEYGLEYYKQAIREIIEDGRRRLQAKVRQVCFPGRYRSVSFYDVLLKDQPGIPAAAAKDLLMHFPLEMTVTREGRLILDFEGANSWGLHPQNCSPAAMEGGLFVAMSQLLSYDGKMNAGNVIGSELRLPYGSWANPDNIFAGTATSWRALIAAHSNWYRTLSYAFYARGYREEILASPANGGTLHIGGINQYGRRFGGGQVGTGPCLGSGARGVMDGIEAAYILWNPTSDMGNLEIFEQQSPVIFLSRSIAADGGGFGKYRGGNSPEALQLLYYPTYAEMGSMGFGYKVLDMPGVMGGYPGAGRCLNIARRTNMEQLIQERRPLPHGEGPDPSNPAMKRLVQAEVWELGLPGGYPARPVEPYDLFQDVRAGGGGYGDPLERDPELVRLDLELGVTTLRTARNIYGVEVDPHTLAVDYEKTRLRRDSLKEARKARGIPAADYKHRQRERVLARRLSPILKEMYADIFRLSPQFAAEYRAYWDLPADFSF